MKTPILLLALLLCGCASPAIYTPFSHTYAANPNLNPLTEFAPHAARAQIMRSLNVVPDATAIKNQGYAAIGAAYFFSGQRIDPNDLPNLAESVQADVVIWGAELADSHTQLIAQSVYSPGTVKTTRTSGNVNGTPYEALSTSVSQGTTTTQNVPVTVNNYRYTAVFLRKLK